jgi:hypothetical protein
MADKILYHTGYLPIDRQKSEKVTAVANKWRKASSAGKVRLFSKRIADLKYEYYAFPIVQEIKISRKFSIPWWKLKINQEFLIAKERVGLADEKHLRAYAVSAGQKWNKTFHVRDAENHFLIKRLS